MSGEPTAVDELDKGLGRFLSDTFERPVAVSNLVASSAGARRRNVLFDADDDGTPLRLAATILPTSEIELNPIAAEAAVRDLAERHGVPTPHIYATCTDPSYVGGPFFVSARVDGESVPRRCCGWCRPRASASSWPASSARPWPSSTPSTRRWPRPSSSPTGTSTRPRRRSPPPRPAPRSWCRRARPSRWACGGSSATSRARRPGGAIVHTDARNGNLIVGADGLRAVLDWEGTRSFGDPMQDVAWPATRMWRFREDEHEIGGFAGRAPFVAGYERAGGTFDEERYEWWKVLGTLRWGLGLAGQAAAHLDGRFPSVVMAASGRRVPELEWDFLMLLRP